MVSSADICIDIRSTVTDINRDLAATLKTCGPAILLLPQEGSSGPNTDAKNNVINEITTTLLSILNKNHACQRDMGEFDDDDAGADSLDESSEYDWLVIETALDAIVCLSAALGPTFANLWPTFSKSVLKFVSSQESAERSAAVGSVADCIGNMGEAVSPFTGPLMKVLVHRLTDSDPETKANATYATGLLIEKSGDEKEVMSSLGAVLGKLEPMLGADGRVLDNAAGCVSRIVGRYPQRVPLDDVLPRLVEILPLREDFEENKAVWGMIIQLCKSCPFPLSLSLSSLRCCYRHPRIPPTHLKTQELIGE